MATPLNEATMEDRVNKVVIDGDDAQKVSSAVTTEETDVVEPAAGEEEEDVDDGIPEKWRAQKASVLVTGILAGQFLLPADDEPRPFDVVMVHGFNGSESTTWGKDGSNWGAGALFEKYPKARVHYCDYSSDDMISSIFTLEGIKANALEILKDLLYYRTEMGSATDNIRPIIFIMHDIGGIIIKMALWIALLEYGKYRTVIDSVRALIFFGTPHRTKGEAILEDMVSNLIAKSSKELLPWRAADNAKSLTRAIMEVNGFFELTNLGSMLENVSITSSAEDFESILDTFTTTLGLPFENIISVNTPHQHLAESPDVEKLYPVIDRVLAGYPTYPAKEDDLSLDSMRAFYHNASSMGNRIRPYEKLGKRFAWVTSHEVFIEWLEGYGTSLLYIHGEERLDEAFNHIVQAIDDMNTLKTKKDILLNFEFRKFDHRCNSVVEMLTMLLAQLLLHNQNMTDFLLFEQLQFYRTWTQDELLVQFRSALNHNDHEGIIVMLRDIDQCDSSRNLFLEDICNFLALTEHRIKILITGHTNSDTENLISNYKTISLKEQSLKNLEAFTRTEINTEFVDLVYDVPKLLQSRFEISNFLGALARDTQSLRLASRYLRCHPDLVQTSEFAAEPPKTVQEIFDRALSSIPHEKQVWARTVLLWTMYGFRPFKTWEIGMILSLTLDTSITEHEDFDEISGFPLIASEIQTIFQGIIIIVNHEVLPGHPDLREFVASSGSKNDYYHIDDSAHEEILKISLRYFTLPHMHRRILGRYLHQLPDDQGAVFRDVFADYFLGLSNYHRYSFCSYAATYWPTHYKKLPPGPERIAITQTFLDDKMAFRVWQEAHWWVENAIRKRTRIYLSTLPVLAHVGLLDLMQLSDDTDPLDRGYALAESARNGHIEVVRALLKYKDYGIDIMEASLNTGACCDNELLLEELVQFTYELYPPVDQAVVSEEKPKEPVNLEVPESDVIVPEPVVFPADSWILVKAVSSSFERLTRLLLKLGASLETYGAVGMTSLDYAVRQRNPAILKLLIDNGIELGKNKTLSYHAIHSAVMYGLPEMVQQLVDAGLDLNLRNTTGLSASYLAAWYRYHKALKPLIAAGADIDDDSKGKWTPLTCCARRDTRKCGEILLRRNANVEVEGFNNWTPLRISTVQGYLEFSRLLLQHKANPNTTSGEDAGPLLCEVARAGNLELVKLLVEHGATLNTANSTGDTPLSKASATGHIDVVEYLLSLGADVNTRNNTGFTPISSAAYSSFSKVIEILAKHGGDIHTASNTEWTPIHYAYDDPETARVLLELGTDVNKVAANFTPLILASYNNHPNTVEVLLKSKPDLEMTYSSPGSFQDTTALGLAVSLNYIEVVKLLLEVGANVNHQDATGFAAIHATIRPNNLEMLKLLLEYNPDVKLQNSYGNTAIHCLGPYTSLEIVRVLVNAGAPLETINKRGYSPLGEAVSEDNFEVTKYLLSKGAEINMTGGELGGPFHACVRNRSFEYVTMFVKAGADVNLLDPRLGTPLQAACSRWMDDSSREEQAALQEKIVKYLIEDCEVDVTIEGGDHGCALNAISGYLSPEMVKLVLSKGVKVNVPDPTGRLAIHLAAAKGLENFLQVHAAGGEIGACDKLGRSVLHWATLAGNVDVIERVLSLQRELLDQPDNDGWTPLMWACRGTGVAVNQRSLVVKKAVIALLLRRGANPSIIAKGGGGHNDLGWSPLSVARYNSSGNDEESTKDFFGWLITELKERSNGKFDESAEVHQSQVGRVASPYCDSCLMTICGLRYQCKACLNTDFCRKCYEQIKLIHPSEHEFNEQGPEFEEETETGKKKDEADSSEDSDEDEKDTPGEEKDEKTRDEEVTGDKKQDKTSPDESTSSSEDSDTDDDD